MIKDIPEPTDKELRSYGLMMGGVLSLFVAIFAYKELYYFMGGLGAIALAFFIFGLMAPTLLAGTHRRWMKFAAVLGTFNLNVILGLIYLTGFTFVRLIFLITGKDPMHRKFDVNAKTYWVEHPEPDGDPRRYEKLY